MNEEKIPIKIRCSFQRLVPIEQVKEMFNPNNPNKHSDEQLSFYRRIIRHQGIRRCVVISKQSNLITRGHGLALACELEGVTQIPCEWQDYDTPDDERADLLADNKLAQLGELDQDAVSRLLDEMGDDFDLTLTGFDQTEIEKLLHTIGQPSLQTEDGAIVDAAPVPADAEVPGSAIKQVAIFLTVATHPVFMGWCRKLQESWQSETLTDVIVEAVRRAAEEEV